MVLSCYIEVKLLSFASAKKEDGDGEKLCGDSVSCMELSIQPETLLQFKGMAQSRYSDCIIFVQLTLVYSIGQMYKLHRHYCVINFV